MSETLEQIIERLLQIADTHDGPLVPSTCRDAAAALQTLREATDRAAPPVPAPMGGPQPGVLREIFMAQGEIIPVLNDEVFRASWVRDVVRRALAAEPLCEQDAAAPTIQSRSAVCDCGLEERRRAARADIYAALREAADRAAPPVPGWQPIDRFDLDEKVIMWTPRDRLWGPETLAKARPGECEDEIRVGTRRWWVWATYGMPLSALPAPPRSPVAGTADRGAPPEPDVIPAVAETHPLAHLYRDPAWRRKYADGLRVEAAHLRKVVAELDAEADSLAGSPVAPTGQEPQP